MAASFVPSAEATTRDHCRLPEACAVQTAPAATAGPCGSAKLGASFTLVTVRMKVRVVWFTPPLAVPPLSWAVKVTMALPFAFAVGVKVSKPLVLTAGCTLKSALLLLPVTTLVMLWPDSSAGPVVMVAMAPL